MAVWTLYQPYLAPYRIDTGPATLNDAGAHLRSVLSAYFVIV